MLELCPAIEGVEYTLCTPEDTDAMASLLANAFTQHDPPAVAVGLTADEFKSFVELWSHSAGADGLSVIGRDVDTHQVVGALLTEDAAATPPKGIEQTSSKLEPILDLLDQLDAEYREGTVIEAGRHLHLFLLGVDRAYTGRKIGQNLVEMCLRNGAVRGYQTAFTEATNPVSQHIFGQHGFSTRVARRYGEYRLGDAAVFASIAHQGGPKLMDRAIEDPA